MILELDEQVAEVVKKLKAKGFVSPYLKTFVVARSNPLRFMKEAPEIKQSDIVASGGTPDDD